MYTHTYTQSVYSQRGKRKALPDFHTHPPELHNARRRVCILELLWGEQTSNYHLLCREKELCATNAFFLFVWRGGEGG